MAKEATKVPFNHGLRGRYIPSLDSSKHDIEPVSGNVNLNEHFSELQNVQYSDNGVIGVSGGMTKINSVTALAKPLIRNAYNFNKSVHRESHNIVQAFSSDLTSSAVFENKTTIPNTGDFDATALHTDVSTTGSIASLVQNGLSITLTASAAHKLFNGDEVVHTAFADPAYNGRFKVDNVTRLTYDVIASYTATDTGTWTSIRRGRFSPTPNENVAYCNDRETMVWGGEQTKLSEFVIIDDAGGGANFEYNYTAQAQNILEDDDNIIKFFQDSGSEVTILVGNNMPIDAINWRVKTANGTTGTLVVEYWTGSAWTAVSSLVDNTDVGGVSLAQSGSMTFDSTETVSKLSMQNGLLGHWFKVTIPAADTATRISNVTVTVPWQPIQDFWDGEFREVASVQMLDQSKFKDITTNVLEDEFTYDTVAVEGGLTSTYGQIARNGVNDITAGTEYLVVGYPEKMMGTQFKFIPERINANAATLTVSYWNGAGWTAVSNLVDGTLEGTASFGNNGVTTWTPIAEDLEFKTKISNRNESLYYYQFKWAQNITTTNLFPYYISGIPSPRLINNFKFPLSAQNRLWLFSGNVAKISNTGTMNTFNGVDSGDDLPFGDGEDIVAATEIFDRTTTKTESSVLVLKQSSGHVVTGTNPEDWVIANLSGTTGIGCNAPLTLATSPLGIEFQALRRKQVAIWQGNGGIYMFDNNGINLISNDIANIFNQDNAESINLKYADLSTGFFTITNGEFFYHWFYASGTSTTLDKELVFDVVRQKWFTIYRGTGKALQGGISVSDSSGNSYSYGYEDNGYLQRLNNGTDYDGNSIDYVLTTSDIRFNQDVNILTILDLLRLAVVSKTTTSNKIKVEHFGDTSTTATKDNVTQLNHYLYSTKRTGFRIAMPMLRVNTPAHAFHKIKLSISTSNEPGTGFEPLFIAGFMTPKTLNEHNLSD